MVFGKRGVGTYGRRHVVVDHSITYYWKGTYSYNNLAITIGLCRLLAYCPSRFAYLYAPFSTKILCTALRVCNAT